MHLRTELLATKSPLRIHYKTPILTLGSCFSEEIGQLLQHHKFNVLNNPYGTVFNPFSIADLLDFTCGEQDFHGLPIQSEDVWLDHRFHSSIYGYSKNELDKNIHQKIHLSQQQLNTDNAVLILTLGTAWVYVLKETNQMVSNCHKQNATLFNKTLCPPASLRKRFKITLDTLFRKYPNTKIILTLSPVRHLKDGLAENQISKSILRVLCHELDTLYSNLHYFPSYELVLDDLRDYHFYKADLIHPNELALEYIWGKFRQTFFEENTNHIVSKWSKIKQQLHHKPFYDKSIAYKKFLQSTLEELESLSSTINVDDEISALKTQLANLSSHDS